MHTLQPCSIIITCAASRMNSVPVYDGVILEARARRMYTLARLSDRYEECKADLDKLLSTGSRDKARIAALRRIIRNLDELLVREKMRNEIIARTHANMFQH